MALSWPSEEREQGSGLRTGVVGRPRPHSTHPGRPMQPAAALAAQDACCLGPGGGGGTACPAPPGFPSWARTTCQVNPRGAARAGPERNLTHGKEGHEQDHPNLTNTKRKGLAPTLESGSLLPGAQSSQHTRENTSRPVSKAKDDHTQGRSRQARAGGNALPHGR